MDIGHWTMDIRQWTLDNGHWTLDIGTMEQWNSLQLQLIELLSVFGLETADLFLFREDDHKY